jgi:TIR domain
MPDYVFLSYDPADRSYVTSLVRRLAAEGIPYWIDARTDSDGFERALAGAAAVIVVVTPRAASSPVVAAQLRLARELGRPILPLIRRRAVRANRARPDGDPFEGLDGVDVTGGGLPPASFFDRVRELTGAAPPEGLPASWRPRVRLPRRLGPLAKTPAETWGVGALLAATASLAVAGVFSGSWNLFLVFPAFGIPDLLFAWFRWRRFRVAGRWSTDVRASILLTGLTAYLTVVAITKIGGPARPFVAGAVVLGWLATVIWVVRAVRDRPR